MKVRYNVAIWRGTSIERAMQLYLRDLLREKEEEAIAKGLEQELEQGLEQGLQQAEKNYIYEMKKEGLPLEVIARIVGKPIEEIREMDLQDN